jgi:hypothetical protein
MADKKDVLEYPLEELEVPAAIKLMMQAAYKTGVDLGVVEEVDTEERLLELSEKLEARVEDAIENAAAVRTEAVPEDAPNEIEVDPADIFIMNDGDILNYKGVVYQKACNELVSSGDESVLASTYCMKRWGHNHPEHEDMEGNRR